MNREAKTTLLTLRVLSDMLAVSVAWMASYYIRFIPWFPTPKGMPDLALYTKLLPFLVGLTLLSFTLTGHYQRTGRHRSPLLESLDIIPSSIVLTISFVTFSYFYEEYRYSRGVTIVFALLAPLLMIAFRSVLRKSIRRIRSTQIPRRVLIITDKKLISHALTVIDQSDLRTSSITKVISVGEHFHFDCNLGPKRVLQNIDPHHPSYAETLTSNWLELVVREKIDSVVIAIPNSQYDAIENILNEISNQVSDIKIVPDVLRYTRFSPGIDLIRGVPVISIHESPLSGPHAIWKRIFDILGSLLALLLFSPVMSLIAFLVFLTSRGPIFYKQERMGLDGKPFLILKFRSMPVDSEKVSGAVWAKPNDGRTTKVGSFIRSCSLDELPQLFNVLMGDMSLVGPRPERPVFVEKFRQEIPGYMLRHKVKAGITGWAQVNGWRGNTSLEKRIEYDLHYIQNWSLFLDIKILFLTIFKGFVNTNAY